jgi:hypothetical protein
MTKATSLLESRIASFSASLNANEQQALTEMEKTAIQVETGGLLQRTTGKGVEMTRTAQQQPPGVLPPQEDPNMPPAVDPNAPPAMDPNAPMAQPAAGPFEQFIDEKESQEVPMGGAEMGITSPIAAYVGPYGHLKIRLAASRDLELYDPGNNQVLMYVRPNQATRSDSTKLRACALAVLKQVSVSGLTKSAAMFRARIRTAGGIVDYGDNTFAQPDKPDYENPGDGINAHGDDVMRGEHYNENGVRSTTNEGDQLTVVP